MIQPSISGLTTWQAELFVQDAGVLTEGPRWDDRTGRLLWVDIYAGTLNSCDGDGGDRRSRATGLPLGAVAPRTAGGFVLALETGLALSGADVAAWTPVGRHRLLPSLVRANDGACDPFGRFFAGTMGHREEARAGALYRLDPPSASNDWPEPVVVIDAVTVSNGLDWSMDGTRLYYVDSAELRLDVFDYSPATGELSNRRPLVSFVEADGFPDGLTVDSDDHIWVAFWDGGVVRRFAPDGALVGIVNVPVARVSSCTFGGDDLTELFITTASYELSDQELASQPLSGSIFRCRPGVAGHPVYSYDG